MFVGLTPPSFGTVFSPRLGNLMVTDFSYSIKPFTRDGRNAIQEFQAELAALGFFRPTTGVISQGNAASTSSDELYLGTEVDLRLNFRPFSDLGFSLSNGVFLPNNDGSDSALIEDAVGAEYQASLEATFSF